MTGTSNVFKDLSIFYLLKNYNQLVTTSNLVYEHEHIESFIKEAFGESIELRKRKMEDENVRSKDKVIKVASFKNELSKLTQMERGLLIEWEKVFLNSTLNDNQNICVATKQRGAKGKSENEGKNDNFNRNPKRDFSLDRENYFKLILLAYKPFQDILNDSLMRTVIIKADYGTTEFDNISMHRLNDFANSGLNDLIKSEVHRQEWGSLLVILGIELKKYNVILNQPYKVCCCLSAMVTSCAEKTNKLDRLIDYDDNLMCLDIFSVIDRFSPITFLNSNHFPVIRESFMKDNLGMEADLILRINPLIHDVSKESLLMLFEKIQKRKKQFIKKLFEDLDSDDGLLGSDAFIMCQTIKEIENKKCSSENEEFDFHYELSNLSTNEQLKQMCNHTFIVEDLYFILLAEKGRSIKESNNILHADDFEDELSKLLNTDLKGCVARKDLAKSTIHTRSKIISAFFGVEMLRYTRKKLN